MLINKKIDLDKTNKLIKTLFKTEYFDQIILLRQKNVLVIKVLEKTTIRSIKIFNSKEEKIILDLMSTEGIGKGVYFNKDTLIKLNSIVKNYFYKKGFYRVTISYKTKRLRNNCVIILVNINTKKACHVKSIRIYGCKNFKESFLKNKLYTKETNHFPIISKDSVFSKLRLNVDLNNLKNFYLENGYLDCRITKCLVSVSKDKTSIYISINIKEGNIFRIGKISFKSNIPDKINEFFIEKDIVRLKLLNFIRLSKVIETKLSIKNYFSSISYNTKINVINKIIFKKKVVDINYNINVGKSVNIKNINIFGNENRSDEIIRRDIEISELQLLESYESVRTFRQIMLNGHIDSISHKILNLSDRGDYIDVVYQVKEKNSNNLEISFGYSEANKFIYKISVKESNFLNTGKDLKFVLDKNNKNIHYDLNYYNPYYTLDRVGLQLNLFYKKHNSFEVKSDSYSADSYGGYLKLLFKISNHVKINLSIELENKKVKAMSVVSKDMKKFLTSNGKDIRCYLLNVDLEHSSIKNKISPVDGLFQKVNFGLSLPISTIRYYFINYNMKAFFPIKGRRLIFNLSSKAGYKNIYLGKNYASFIQSFYAGGTDTIRGFADSGVGPRNYQGRLCGGNILLSSSFNIIIPDSVKKKNYNNALCFFFDIVKISNSTKLNIDLEDIRCSLGISYKCISPLGPLVFNLAIPLHYDKNDIKEYFSFSIGSY